MKHLKTYNESLRDKMKPKSDEEILKDLGKLTPKKLLFKSIEYNYLNGVKIALEKGVDINAHDEYGWDSLLIASRNGYEEIVEFLLKNGANVNLKNNNGFNTLLYAAKFKNKEIVELIRKQNIKE